MKIFAFKMSFYDVMTLTWKAPNKQNDVRGSRLASLRSGRGARRDANPEVMFSDLELARTRNLLVHPQNGVDGVLLPAVPHESSS